MKSIIIFTFLFTFCSGFSQTPSDDPNFEEIFSDDFASLDRSKWKIYNGESWCPTFIDDASTISVSGGKLNLTANYTPSGSYPYTSGAIRSLQNFYPGTYFECKSIIPIGINAYPSFWVWDGLGTCEDNNYREIDILEWWNYYNVSSANLHYCNPPACYCLDDRITGPNFFYFINDPHTSHIYSCFWNKNKIFIMTDQNIVKEWVTPSKLSTNSMRIQNGLAVLDKDKDGTSILDVGSFPFTYQTDYIKAYRLKKDCDSVITFIDFSTYIYKLKKSIALSGSTTVPSGGSISLRAVDFIELKDGFEVPNNTNFYLNINECF